MCVGGGGGGGGGLGKVLELGFEHRTPKAVHKAIGADL